jgi:putative tryptophan/tyrosine transport system substrate-binding protein
MKRREFITLIGGAAAAWPVSVAAQRAGKLWRIGLLDSATRELNSANVDVFLGSLREFGYVEGQNLVVDYRSAGGRDERLPDLVAELIRLNPEVIVVRGTPEVLAVRNVTSTIPVVMTAVVDPVGLGVADSLSHPGGNVTGMSSIASAMGTKRVGLLKELVPGMRRMAWLGDFRNSSVGIGWEETQIAARALGIEAVKFDVQRAADVSRAFNVARNEKVDADAIIVSADGTTRPNRRLIIDLVAMNRLPAIYTAREFVDEGGLMAYGTDYANLYRRAASFVDKIFKGAKPAELPIEQPTRFELVINLRAAKALGIDVPPALLATADAVIE